MKYICSNACEIFVLFWDEWKELFRGKGGGRAKISEKFEKKLYHTIEVMVWFDTRQKTMLFFMVYFDNLNITWNQYN